MTLYKIVIISIFMISILLYGADSVRADQSKDTDAALLWVDLNTTKSFVSTSHPISVKINDFRIIGPRRYKFFIFTEILSPYIGHTVSFSQLVAIVNKIAGFYRSKGFPVNFAFVPGQVIKNGVVTIVLVEAKYDKIKINNKSGISDKIVRNYFSGEESGKDININPLNSDLLASSEYPYTKVTTVLSPGGKPATSNLDIDVVDQPYIGSIGVNDYGDPYLGSMVLSAYAQLNNLFGNPDTLSVSGMTSFGGFNSIHVSYDDLLNKYGTHIGVYYSAMNYRLGLGFTPINYPANAGVLAALGSSGYGQTMGIYVRHPIVRTKNTVIALKMIYEHDLWSDTISQALGEYNNRTIDSIAAEIDGDLKFPTNETTFMGSAMPYILNASTPANIDPYASTSQGLRFIWKALITTTQMLANNNSLYVSLSGQVSSGGIIDPMEQMVFGGENSVRAYPTAVLFADTGAILNIELRHLYAFSKNTLQPFAFFDMGGFNYAGYWFNIYGPGVGVGWNYIPWDLSSKLEVSMPIGAIPYMVGTPENYQVWFSVTKNFK